MTKIISSRLLAALALAGCLTALAVPARAQDGNPPPQPAFSPAPAYGGAFGATGQWVLSLRGDGDEYAFLHKPGGGGWTLSLNPSIDYFIANNISVGGMVGATVADNYTALRAGARAGFNLNVSGKVTFWPMAGIYVNHQRPEQDSNTSVTLGIFAPFLYHLVPHLFIGLGPRFDLSLSSDGNLFGIDAVLGGWL